MRSLPTSKATYKCRWADCEIDLTHSNRSFAHHIVEDHRLDPTHVCEWESCFKKGYPFASAKELISHVRSEHTKTKYFRCSQQDCDLYFQHESALKHHKLRDHEQAVSSRSSSRNASKISLYNPGLRQPDHLRRVFSLSSLRIPGTGSQSALEISQTLVQHSLIQAMQKKIVENWFFVAPLSPLSPTSVANPFSHAKLNNLTGKVLKEGAIGGGSFADVYMGTWMTGTAQKKVAIKELRVHTYHQRTSKLEKRLRREMRIWGNLDHVNIVPLHGVTFSFGKCPAMVCEWMNQGTLADYIEEEHVNLDYRGRLNICLAITRGLSYLHSHKVIHGDLSPANVLMDGDVAHLSDFGLSNVIAELQGPSFFTSKVSCAARWIAPELQSSQDSAPILAMPCDIYSFASVAFYIMTGIFPFAHLRHEYQIIAEILRNIQAGLNPSPSRPASSFLTDECWDILMMCWALDPAKRPDIFDVERRFNQL